jgi:hypothetical protein
MATYLLHSASPKVDKLLQSLSDLELVVINKIEEDPWHALPFQDGNSDRSISLKKLVQLLEHVVAKQ